MWKSGRADRDSFKTDMLIEVDECATRIEHAYTAVEPVAVMRPADLHGWRYCFTVSGARNSESW